MKARTLLPIFRVGLLAVTLGASCLLTARADDDDAPAGTPEDETLWSKLDVTEDGWLDGKELNGGWKKYDADSDDEVTKEEFIAGRAKERGASTLSGAAEDAQLFKKLDASGNGYLSGKELDGGNARAYDSDADNRVTLEEFLVGRAKDRGGAAAKPKTNTAAKPPVAKPTTAKPAADKAVMPVPAVASASKISGLFYMQKYWIATRYLEKATWYFAPDGKVYVNLTSGFSPAELAAFTGQVGTYKVAGGNLSVTWPKGEKSEAEIEIVPGGWNWNTGMYLPIAPFTGAAQAAGSYEGGTSFSFSGGSTAVAKTLDLREGGAFSWGGIAAFKSEGETTGAAQGKTTGKWALSGYTMTLTDDDGKVVRGIAFPFEDEKNPTKPERIFFAGTSYKRLK